MQRDQSVRDPPGRLAQAITLPINETTKSRSGLQVSPKKRILEDPIYRSQASPNKRKRLEDPFCRSPQASPFSTTPASVSKRQQGPSSYSPITYRSEIDQCPATASPLIAQRHSPTESYFTQRLLSAAPQPSRFLQNITSPNRGSTSIQPSSWSSVQSIRRPQSRGIMPPPSWPLRRNATRSEIAAEGPAFSSPYVRSGIRPHCMREEQTEPRDIPNVQEIGWYSGDNSLKPETTANHGYPSNRPIRPGLTGQARVGTARRLLSRR